jgi:nucleoside-diphosphate-sugar epimerase
MDGSMLARLLAEIRPDEVLFGNVPPPQREDSGFDPASPYAAAKVFAHHVAGLYGRVRAVRVPGDPVQPRVATPGRDVCDPQGDASGGADRGPVPFGLVGLDWCEHVEVDARYLRPKDVALLVGDASRAQKELGWAPKVRFRELVQIMLQADLEREGIDPANVLTVPPLPTRPEWAERP